MLSVPIIAWVLSGRLLGRLLFSSFLSFSAALSAFFFDHTEFLEIGLNNRKCVGKCLQKRKFWGDGTSLHHPIFSATPSGLHAALVRLLSLGSLTSWPFLWPFASASLHSNSIAARIDWYLHSMRSVRRRDAGSVIKFAMVVEGKVRLVGWIGNDGLG